MELKNKKVAFLGDSITAGCGTSGAGKDFVALFGKMAECAEVLNYGIGGTRIAPWQPYSENMADGNFCGRVEELDENADIIVVFGGTNDFCHGNAPLGTPDDHTPATFYGACHFLMNRLVERFCGKPIVILTPLHRHGEDTPREDNATLKSYVNALKDSAEWYALPVLDLFAVSGIQPCIPGVQQKLCPDGLHPNDAGHRILAERIYAFLRSL